MKEKTKLAIEKIEEKGIGYYLIHYASDQDIAEIEDLSLRKMFTQARAKLGLIQDRIEALKMFDGIAEDD